MEMEKSAFINEKRDEEITKENKLLWTTKLTEAHVFAEKIPKMKLKHTAQVFSQRISTALCFRTNMEVPGMSLFRGAGSIHINNSAQDRLDEQEELEDQKRRNEELKHKLDNAFDDLVDDDDASSVNSSANLTMSITQPDSGQGDNPNAEDFKTRKPPGYTESMNHLKDRMRSETPKSQVHCETPKSHNSPYTEANEPLKFMYNVYGAGDGQNNVYHQQYPVHLNGLNNFDAHQELMNQEQLKLMYEMRVKECQQLAEQLEALRTHSNAETEGLRARLVTACNDRDRAELSLQQAQHLLASSKHNIVNLEQQISGLNKRLAESEQEKEQLKLELLTATAGLQDAQQRLQNIQVARIHDNDALFREQQDRHREEAERLHDDLMKTKNRLEEKENEIKILEQRCLEKDRAKEELLIEKGAKINRLASELEAAQNRLMSGESAKLKERVSQLTSERNMAKDQVKELGSKLELTAHELVLCRNKLSQTQKQFEEFWAALNQIIQESLPDQAYLGEPASPNKLSTLKEILNKCKQQGQKITNLQEEVIKRDKKLEACRNQELELRSKLEERKSVEMQLNSKIALLQNKLELLGNESDAELLMNYKQQNSQLEEQLKELRAEHKAVELKYAELELQYEHLRSEKTNHASLVQEANADLLRELERISNHLKETLKECAELKTLYVEVCSARDSVSRELQDTKSKLALMQREKTSTTSQEKELLEKLDKERQQVVKLTSELAIEKEGLERANKRISELQKEFTDKQKEFTDRLNKYIEEEKSTVCEELKMCAKCEKSTKRIKNLEEQLAKCNLRIATQESNEELMQELKSKAEFFQKYILDRFQKIQDQRHVATNTEWESTSAKETADNRTDKRGNDTKKLTSSENDDLVRRTDLMLKEKEIREQIAEKFTVEMKTVEINYTKKLKELENDTNQTITKLKQLLEQKAEEVETLKKFILTERSKISEILDTKENEISVLIKENNSLQEDYQELTAKTEELKTVLEKAQGKLSKLKSELDKKNGEVMSEREKSDRIKTELIQQQQVLESKVGQLEAQYDLLKEKYRNVKKTALVYKDYASKKDEHVASELDRIKTHYQGLLTQMQEQLHSMIQKRQQQEVTERINKIQSNFNAVMSEGTSSQKS